MGRRKLITQKELNAIMKSKNPHIYFFVFSIFFLIGAIILFCINDLEFLGCGPLLLSLVFFITALCVKPQKEEKEQDIESKPTNTTVSQPQAAEKPRYDFFAKDTVIDAPYLKKLIEAQKYVSKPYRQPYDGMESERLLFVDYNEKTHSAKATYEVTKYYRTVERYVQQNYQRTPIYSALKSKVKQYTKTYKLTNNNLANLNSEFSYSNQHLYLDLIVALNNPLLVPYHFFLISLGKQLEIAINYNEYLIKDAEKTHENLKFDAESKIKILFSKIELTKKPLEKWRSKLGKLKAKFEKKPSPKLENKIIEIEDAIGEVVSFVNQSQQEIGKLQKDVSISENSTKAKTNDIKDHIKQIRNTYHSLLKKFKPLQIEATDANDFTPLSALAGMEYTKIIGCYVLRNTENNRCYVGQSKDVMKRLKQHFKGTVPHNVIFAEDYYSSKVTDKEWLFEFKIIPCETKDELDQTEKLLIEEYDAFTTGYNGTHGNS